MVEADPPQTVRELARLFGVGGSTISRHLNAIGKVKELDKWIPCEPTIGRMLESLNTCYFDNGAFFRQDRDDRRKRILYDDRRRSAQWQDKNERPNETPKPSIHPKKTTMAAWWTMFGIVHYKFLKTGETIIAEKYCAEVEVMHQKLIEKQPAL